MRRRRTAPLILFATIGAVAASGIFGCGGAGRSDTVRAFSIRDSAGVQIIDNGGKVGRPDTLLTLHETMRIASADDSDSTRMFFGVGPVVTDVAGRIYVADNSRRIRVFAEDGHLLRVIGGPGKGPGEFQSIISIMPHGDTIGVFDLTLRRITRFNASGTVAGDESTNSASLFPASNDNFLFAWPEAILADGLIVSMRMHKSFPGPGLKHDTVTFRRLPSIQAAYAMAPGWDTISVPTRPIRFEGPTRWMENDGSSYRWGPLWSAQPQAKHDESGRMFISDGMHYRIDVYDVDGKLERSILRNHKPVPITKKLVNGYYDFVANVVDTVKLPGPASAPSSTRREPGASNARTMKDLEMTRRVVPHGKTMPALGTLLVAPNGAVWVERPDLVDDPIAYEWDHRPRPQQYWDIIDRAGRYVGTAKLPAGFRAIAVTEHSIIGVTRDEDDIEIVVAYSISPVRAPAARSS